MILDSLVFDYLPSGNCPVQSEGFINGKPFYFRARGAGWSFSVGSSTLFPDWSYSEGYGTGFESGWMDEKEATTFIFKALTLYLGVSSEGA